MNCTICSQPTLLGAKLCTACGSALKRARDESILELPKRPDAAARDRRRMARRAPAGGNDPAVGAGTSVRLLHGWGGYAALAALGVTVLMAGYLGGRSTSASETSAVTPVPHAAALPALAPSMAPRAEPRPAPLVLQETARVEVSPTPSVSPAQEAIAKAPVLRPAPAPVTAKESSVRAGGVARSSDVETLTTPGDAVEPARPARIASTSAVGVAQPAPEPDRGGSLTEMLNRCGREAFFSRPSCEQRARAQHCGGLWGQTSQCPNPMQYDHSR